MRVLLQRVNFAKVTVNSAVVGSISKGLLLLAGIHKNDSEDNVRDMARKIATLRIFPDDKGRFDKSVLDIGGDILVVSQFTLFADTSKGRRPEFFDAMRPEAGAPALCEKFVACLTEQGVARIEQGIFGAMMQVALENDGPVTIMLDS